MCLEVIYRHPLLLSPQLIFQHFLQDLGGEGEEALPTFGNYYFAWATRLSALRATILPTGHILILFCGLMTRGSLKKILLWWVHGKSPAG